MSESLDLKSKVSRRNFIKGAIVSGAAIARSSFASPERPLIKKSSQTPKATIYRAVNASPEKNVEKLFELMGGVENLVGRNDIVVIKPNVQWWNQGAPNLLLVKSVVDTIMNRPSGFEGEVVVAENCHRGEHPWRSDTCGWDRPFSVNSNAAGIAHFNDLTAVLKRAYKNRFSTCHWIDVSAGSRRVYSPSDGTGYVYCDGTGGVALLSFSNGERGGAKRETIMTYPIFRTDAGTVVDFKNGVWADGSYTHQPLRFINFASVNHHSTYCGMTSSLKNYLGVTDLSGGPDPHSGGKLTEKYFNFHSFPFDKWEPGPKPGMLGAEIGEFMNTIRRADLNIVSAEWIGLSSRVDPPVARTRALLAGTDPVALDYHSAKYILYPNSRISFHNPEDESSPAHQYLAACAAHGGGVLDENKVAVQSWDSAKGRLQKDDELVVRGPKEWGGNPKAILKYLLLRYGSFFL